MCGSLYAWFIVSYDSANKQKQRRSQGGAEGAEAPPLAIRILMFIS